MSTASATPPPENISVRGATAVDLEAINTIIQACVMSWNLPERVKRLTLDSYRYHATDLEHFDVFVATADDNDLVGVAALSEPARPDLPEGQSGLLLHGLYVAPGRQQQGIGRYLLQHALNKVADRGLDGLLVKAQPDANAFFQRQGFAALAITDVERSYPHRWWQQV